LETNQGHLRGFSLGHASADAVLQRGLLSGALHEVYVAERHAAAGTGFALMLALRLASKKNILWTRQDFSAVPCGELSGMGFLDLGLDPNWLVLVRAATAIDALRAAADSISCKALGAVLLELWGETKVVDLVASRRLTLSAARSGVSIIVLNFSALPRVSTAETRWMIEPEPSAGEDWGNPIFSAALLRNRHGRTGRFLMEWSCDERIFREPANTRAMVSAIAGGTRAKSRAKTWLRRTG
jgi:protein ImuA